MANYIRVFEENHSYFITVVTHKRRAILIKNIELLRKSFQLSMKRYDYSINAIVILPDHFHMIITPKCSHEYSKIISHIKRSFVYGLDKKLKYECKLQIGSSQYKRQLSGVWQKRFYEHTIRNEKDMYLHLDYICQNSVKHGYVENAEDWKYSSFHKSL